MISAKKHSFAVGVWGIQGASVSESPIYLVDAMKTTFDHPEMVCQHQDYRGIVGVIMGNMGQEAFTVEHGMRIAQMVVAPVMRAGFDRADSLDETPRGAGGFGSTGAH